MLSCFSHVWLCVTLWTVACQASLSMGFSSQEYWSGLPCSPPGNLPDPGIESASLMFSCTGGRFFTTSTTWEAPMNPCCCCCRQVAQSCPTLWDPMDCSLPGFSVHGILQIRTLEWVAISFSYTYPSFNQLLHLAISLGSSLEPLLKHLPNWATLHHQISYSIFVQPWELETSYWGQPSMNYLVPLGNNTNKDDHNSLHYWKVTTN